MTSSSQHTRLTVFVAALSLVVLTGPGLSPAQTTDITSSGLNTLVSAPIPLPDGTMNYDITGGTRPGGGANLFHSFGEFSVGTNNIANFLNETALPTSNILSRVTGGNPSNVFGTLQTTNFGTANLYLINHAGVVFGPNASLNVGGSVNISTADYLKMTDGAKFHADPAQPTVLSMAPVAAFGFLAANPAAISVQGSTLTVQPGQSISLVGGNQGFTSTNPDTGIPVTVPGGVTVTGSTISAPSGRINLASVASPGEVVLGPVDQGRGLQMQGFTQLGSITIQPGTHLNTAGDPGGSIVIRSGRLTVDGATLVADSQGDQTGAPLAMDLQLTGDALITNDSFIKANAFGAGNAGNTTIQAQTLTVTDGGQVQSNTFGPGKGGDITVTADTILLQGTTPNFGGLTGEDGLGLFTNTYDQNPGAGSAGNITLQAQSLTVADVALVSSFTFGPGKGGDITVTADTILLQGTTPTYDGPTGLFTYTFDPNPGAGSAGNITLQAQSLTVADRAQVSSTTGGPGRGGDIAVMADTFLLQGLDPIVSDLFPGGPFTGLFTGGGSVSGLVENIVGNITIQAQNLTVTGEAAEVSSSPQGPGHGGDIAVTADTILLQGTLSGFFSAPIDRGSGSGEANLGNITIQTQTLSVVDGAQVQSTTFGSGRGGDIIVTADTVLLQGTTRANIGGPGDPARAGGLLAAAEGTDPGAGSAGNITIQAQTLTVADGARVSSSTLGPGAGGAVTINATDSVTLSGHTAGLPSGIFARSSGAGNAGAIIVNAGRLNMTSTAEISSNSASSASNAGNAGQISVHGSTGSDSIATYVSLDNSTISTTIAGGTSWTTPATIDITAQTVNLTNGAQISADTLGGASAGAVTLTATESIALTHASVVSSSSFGSGNAGGVSLIAPTIALADSFSSISSTTGSTGDAGAILIEGTMVGVTNGAEINSSTFGAGNAGTVTIRAKEAVMVAGSDPETGFTSSVASATVVGTGTAGKVTIEAPSIEISDRGTVFTSNSPLGGRAGDIILDGRQVTIAGGGQVTSSTESNAPGGTVTIKATDFLAISGSDSQGNASRVSTATLGDGDAGQVVIETPTFTMNGGEIVAFSGNIDPFTGQLLPNSGDAGSIDITVRNASFTGGAQVQASSIDKGQGGRVTISASDSLLIGGADAKGFSTTISSSTSGAGNAGEVTLSAPTMTITDGAFVTTSSGVAGKGGAVTLEAGRLSITGGSGVDSSTFGTGQGGSVTITATEQMRLTGRNDKGPSQITTITAGSGNAGQIFVTTPVLEVQEGAIFANTGTAGNAGSIMIEAGQLSLANDALIASRSVQNATGDAGSVNLQATGLFSSQASTVSSEAKRGAGGNVSITGGNMQLTGGTTISAESAGSEDAGSIALTSASDLLMRNSTVTTFAAEASGGNIKLTAPNLVRLVDSTLISSVQGNSTTKGGNINIDPQLVVIQSSQLLANANAGAGGNINIAATGAVLVDPNSLLSATAGPAGVSGSVNINAPIQVLSGALVPLNLVYSQAGLSGDRCAADPQGQFSSFVQTGRDGVPQVPGALSPSPLPFLDTLTSGSLRSPWPNLAAARLGLDSVSFDESTLIRFHSACRS